MNAEQRLEEIRRTDNVIQAFRNLLIQLGMVEIDSSKLGQYRQDLTRLENRLSLLIHTDTSRFIQHSNLEGTYHP